MFQAAWEGLGPTLHGVLEHEQHGANIVWRYPTRRALRKGGKLSERSPAMASTQRGQCAKGRGEDLVKFSGPVLSDSEIKSGGLQVEDQNIIRHNRFHMPCKSALRH